MKGRCRFRKNGFCYANGKDDTEPDPCIGEECCDDYEEEEE